MTMPSKSNNSAAVNGWIVAPDPIAASKTVAVLNNGTSKWRTFFSPTQAVVELAHRMDPADVVVMDLTKAPTLAAMTEALGSWVTPGPIVAIVSRDLGPEEAALRALGAAAVIVSNGDPSPLLDAIDAAATSRTGGRPAHEALIDARTLPFPLLRLSPDGDLLFANKALALMLGYRSSAELYELHEQEIIPVGSYLDRFRLHSSVGISDRAPGELLHRTGRSLSVRVYSRPIHDSAGELLYFECAVTDAAPDSPDHTAQIDHQMETIFERSPIAYWVEDFSQLTNWLTDLRESGVTDINGYLDANPGAISHGISLIKVIDVNPAALRLIGATNKDELLANGLGAIDTGESMAAFREQVVALWNGEPSLRTLGHGTTVDGRPIDYILTWVSSGSANEAVIVSMEDITELSDARSRLEYLGELKDRFIDSITHELRTPLTGVLGFTNLIREHLDGADSELDEFLDLLETAAEEGGAILDNLLLATELDINGELHMPTRPGEAAVDLLAQARVVVGTLSPDSRVKITIASEGVEALGIPVRVRQIIRNLLRNAVTHGGPDVSVTAAQEDRISRLVVTDNGAGIPESELDRAFIRYESFRIDPGLTQTLGLGLTVSRALARAMGGDLRYERTAGNTQFVLELPATPV